MNSLKTAAEIDRRRKQRLEDILGSNSYLLCCVLRFQDRHTMFSLRKHELFSIEEWIEIPPTFRFRASAAQYADKFNR